MPEPQRGDVWLADLNPSRGHEQAGARPVLIFSVDEFNRGPADLIVVLPITSTIRPIPLHVLAPYLLVAEVTNALYKRVLRGELDLSTAEAALDVILAFGVELLEEPALAARALSLARHLRRPTTYDCHYLALAERYECALWTGDRRFYNAVHRAEPRVRWIGASAESASGRGTPRGD